MNYLNKGIKAHQANDLTYAKKCYLSHLDNQNKDPNANQLLGLIYFNEKNFLLAKKHMKLSLKYNPKQPHVLVNLSSVYSNLELIEKSISSLRSAIKLDNSFVNAYINLIRIYRMNRRFREAEELVLTSLIKFPNNLILIKELGEIYKLTNRDNDLILFYQKNESIHQNDLKLKFDLALALRKVGKPNEALVYYNILIESGMKNYQLYHNMANAYSDIGNLETAIIHYSNAINENPLYIDSHINLNELLWEQDKLDIFLSSYINTLQLYPDDLALNFNYISALIRTSNIEQAKKEIDNLTYSLLQTSNIQFLNAKCSYHKNKIKDAIQILEKNIHDKDVDNDYLLEYAKYLIENNQPKTAIKPLLKILSLEPKCQMAIAYLGVCYRLTNNLDETLLNNYELMVKEYKISVPRDYESIGLFCQEINKYLDELHTSQIQPLEQSLSNGTQTRGNLFDNNNKILNILLIEIEKCLAHYNQNLSESNISYGIKPVDQYNYSGSWSVRLKKQGYHSMHIHPMGWLSAVFYVDLPCEISTTNEKCGWLKFGEPNFNLTPHLPATYFAKPEIGKLIIFPSYMWHGTIAFKSNEYRTTIAFDVKEVKN